MLRIAEQRPCDRELVPVAAASGDPSPANSHGHELGRRSFPRQALMTTAMTDSFTAAF